MHIAISILAWVAIVFGTFVFAMNVACHIVSFRERRFVSAVYFAPTIFAGAGMLLLPVARAYCWLPFLFELSEFGLAYAITLWASRHD